MKIPFENPTPQEQPGEQLSEEERRRQWEELPEVKEGKILYESLPWQMRTGGYILPSESEILYPSEEVAKAAASPEQMPLPSVMVTFKDGKRLELSLNYGVPPGKTTEQHYREQIDRIKAVAADAQNVASVEEIWSLSGF